MRIFHAAGKVCEDVNLQFSIILDKLFFKFGSERNIGEDEIFRTVNVSKSGKSYATGELKCQHYCKIQSVQSN